MKELNLPGLAQLARLTFFRQLTSRKTPVAMGFLVLIAALVVTGGVWQGWTARRLGKDILLPLFSGFFVPIVCLAYGTGALGDDRDERSLVHLLARALPRSGIALAKLVGVAPIPLLFNAGGLWLLCRLGGFGAREDLAALHPALWPSVFWSTLAYLALFHLLTVLFRHSTAIAVAYVFFVEVLIGQLPGILKRVSVHFYANCLAYERGAAVPLAPADHQLRLYVPVTGAAALWVLVALSLGLAALGAVAFARREHRT